MKKKETVEMQVSNFNILIFFFVSIFLISNFEFQPMVKNSLYLKIIDIFVFFLILLILLIYFKVSASEAWPRARDAQRRDDLRAISQAIGLYQQSGQNSQKLAPFVNDNNIHEQEQNYQLMIKIIAPQFLTEIPNDPRGQKSPQGYGYLAMQNDKNQIAKIAKDAKNFRLGAYSENTSKNFHFYDLSITPIKGNIYYP